MLPAQLLSGIRMTMRNATTFIIQNSYRSKLVGIFGQIILVKTICKVHGIPEGAIECRCDGKGALATKVFLLDNDIKTAGSHFDLLSATCTALQDSPITWTSVTSKATTRWWPWGWPGLLGSFKHGNGQSCQIILAPASQSPGTHNFCSHWGVLAKNLYSWS